MGNRFGSRPAEERFWEKVDYNGPKILDTPCWQWTAYKNCWGHAKFYFNGRQRYAHRFAYESRKGKIPDKMLVLHSCDNGACVNPDHLRIGTAKDNTRDCIERKRFKGFVPGWKKKRKEMCR